MAERIKLVLAIPDKPEANPFLETLTKTQFPLEITGKVNRFEDL